MVGLSFAGVSINEYKAKLAAKNGRPSLRSQVATKALPKVPSAFGIWHTKRYAVFELNEVHGDFRRVLGLCK